MKHFFSSVVFIACICLLIFAPVSSSAQEYELPGSPAAVRLVPGKTVSGILELGKDGQGSASFSFSLPESAYGFRVSLSDSPADLDLVISNEAGEEVSRSELEEFNETIYENRLSNPQFTAGLYTVDVVYQLSLLPVIEGKITSELPFDILLEIIAPSAERELIPGRQHRSVLQPESGMIKVFSVSVPETVENLRIDLFDTEGDLDLFLYYESYRPDPFLADYRSETYLSKEHLHVSKDSPLPLQGGTYYIAVIDQIETVLPEDFSIVVSFSEDAPGILSRLPVLPRYSSPLENALLSTVEIMGEAGGGSGCLVSEDGYILTNWHVVRDFSGKADDDLTVSLSLAHDAPPAELFKARVVRMNRERDLALLKIEKGFYDQPVPDSYRFPYLSIGEDLELAIGEPLGFIGYPSIGGTGSRVSITFTRGIVSGYQKSKSGRIIKTDAEINTGNSGGAAVNSSFELIGIPSQIVGEAGGQIGFISPVSLIPDSWLVLIGARR
jgi:S1-C subfamily serine protease